MGEGEGSKEVVGMLEARKRLWTSIDRAARRSKLVQTERRRPFVHAHRFNWPQSSRGYR